MAVHEKLGHKITIEGHALRIGHLRADRDLGVASNNGITGGFVREKPNGPLVRVSWPAFLVRLSDLTILRQLEEKEDFDEAILTYEPRD